MDDYSQKLLGSVLKQFDILQENVSGMFILNEGRICRSCLTSTEVIESITHQREPQPGTDAMYLLMPTSQNVDRIIKDFDCEHPQYGAAHLFFIEGEWF